MAKAILLVVSDGFGGYGDFLFALKMAQNLQKECEVMGKEITPMYLVTQDTGKRKILALKGDVEFGVEVLTPTELKARIETADAAYKIEVGAIIEGPVFKSELIDRVDEALQSIADPVPLTLISEYSNSPDIFIDESYRATLKKIVFERTILSGLNYEKGERGILVSESLARPKPPSVLVAELDEKIRGALIDVDTIEEYQEHTELWMQYSHDIYTPKDGTPTPAEHFLRIHHELVRGHAKHQDVLMIGTDLASKRYALLKIKDRLIAEGYIRIAFYHVSVAHEELLYGESIPRSAGKSYRVIYAPSMPHPSMMACVGLSGALIGATGDQSLGEAVSYGADEESGLGKVISYECLNHKTQLISNYDKGIERIAGVDPDIREALSLLRKAKSDEQYERLGKLLGTPSLRAQLSIASKAVIKKGTLVPLTASIVFVSRREAVSHIGALLRAGDQLAALKAFLDPRREEVTIFDELDGKSLFANAQENNPEGIFVRYFRDDLDRWLLQVIVNRDEEEAIRLVLERGLNAHSIIANTTLWFRAIRYGLKALAENLGRSSIVYSLENGDQEAALHSFKQMTSDPDKCVISASDVFDGKSLLHHAVDEHPGGVFVKNFIGNDADALLFRAIVNQRQDTAIGLARVTRIPFSHEIVGKSIIHYILENESYKFLNAHLTVLAEHSPEVFMDLLQKIEDPRHYFLIIDHIAPPLLHQMLLGMGLGPAIDFSSSLKVLDRHMSEAIYPALLYGMVCAYVEDRRNQSHKVVASGFVKGACAVGYGKSETIAAAKLLARVIKEGRLPTSDELEDYPALGNGLLAEMQAAYVSWRKVVPVSVLDTASGSSAASSAKDESAPAGGSGALAHADSDSESRYSPGLR